MTKTRNLSDLLDANGDVKSGALDNVPPSNDASALTTGTLPDARLSSAIVNQSAFKNIIINGDMSIAQRETIAQGLTSTGYYTVDRFEQIINSMGTWTISQSTDVPSGQGFANSMKWDCTTADASPSANDYLILTQRIEGQNLQYLKKGTANAQSLTCSFWVKSNKTGTYIAELFDRDNTRTIARSYTIDSANTWEKKTVTFAGDTTGILDNDANVSLDLQMFLGAGSDWTSGTLETDWETPVKANRAVGQVNLADSTANEWYITGVQLEAGEVASDFEFLPYDINLRRCMRYCISTPFINNANSLTAPTTRGNEYQGSRQRFADVLGYRSQYIHYPEKMRASPSITIFNGNNSGVSGQFQLFNQDGATQNFSGFVQSNELGFNFAGYTGISVGDAGGATMVANVHWIATSEL